MIKIESIRVHKMRGIKDLTLTFNSQNYAICGSNGTGKSGVVDAIEFALTGSISRLSGAGSKDLSIKKHGAHVDFVDDLENAFVEVELIIPSLNNKKVSVKRKLSSPNSPEYSATNENIAQVLDQVQMHPEYVLSRREIIRYVLSESGKRSKEIQALLRLEKLEKIRTLLQKIYKSEAKDLLTLQKRLDSQKLHLKTALGVENLTKASLLAEVNKRRSTLKLQAITNISKEFGIKEGLVKPEGEDSQETKINKKVAIEDLKNFQKAVAELSKDEIQSKIEKARNIAEKLLADAELLDDLSVDSLLQSALAAFNQKECPVCETEFENEIFLAIVNRKLEKVKSVKKDRDTLESLLHEIQSNLLDVRVRTAVVIKYAAQLEIEHKISEVVEFRGELRSHYKSLESVLPLSGVLDSLKFIQSSHQFSSSVDLINDEFNKLTDNSDVDDALEFLTIVEERLSAVAIVKAECVEKSSNENNAKKVFDAFVASSNKSLDQIYEDVSTIFADLYSVINNDDESGFTASLIAGAGKLDLDVDFYGRGQFPPAAYHSEGHQDSMGICLYLALIDKLLGDGFTIAVLDDVLMSVDTGHRREICSLLKSRFPNVQFIITTHDKIWLNHMKSEGLVSGRNFSTFKSWSVDHGPTDWSSLDIWQEINEYLEQNDVRSAAALLRHYLEFQMPEFCGKLRAKIEFKPNASYTLGDTLSPATEELKSLLSKALKAERSWDNTEEVSKLESFINQLQEVKKECDSERWQVNTAVHFNDWDNLEVHDFRNVSDSYKSLCDLFRCEKCNSLITAEPTFGKRQKISCLCGEKTFTLTSKK